VILRRKGYELTISDLTRSKKPFVIQGSYFILAVTIYRLASPFAIPCPRRLRT
jgi:hypothetical protein